MVSGPGTRLNRSIVLAEPARDEPFQRGHDLGGLPPGSLDLDRSAGTRREHHQAHDGRAAHGLATARHADLGVVFLHRLHELGRCAGVEPAGIDDVEHADDGILPLLPGTASLRSGRGAHLPASTRLATVMYLRPASWAWATASASGLSHRTLASLTSIGRLIPANTSTRGWFITEIDRLDGVPPNISVRITTPSPLSTCLTASMMSRRRRSTSSSGPIVTASICSCGPTTCSRAARNSTASRPWVTRTIPIIEAPRGRRFDAPHERAPIMTMLNPSARGFLWTYAKV